MQQYELANKNKFQQGEANKKQDFRNILNKGKKEYDNQEQKIDQALELEKRIKRKKKTGDYKFPSITQWPKDLSRLGYKEILKTILSGILFSVIIIPQSMAFSLMIGMPAQNGVYTSAYGAIIYSFLGYSRQASVGASTTSILMIATAVQSIKQSDRLIALQTVSLLIGIFILMMFIFRLSFLQNVYSIPCFQGYFKAANLIILIEQLSKILQIPIKGHNIFTKSYSLFSQLSLSNYLSLYLFSILFPILLLSKCLNKHKYPNSIILQFMPFIVIIIGTIIIYYTGFTSSFKCVKNFPKQLPLPNLPWINLKTTIKLIPQAAKIAIVSFSESILLTQQIANSQQYHLSTTYEAFAYGITNIINPFLGGFLAVNSITRTPLFLALVNHHQLQNYVKGVKNQFSGLISGITVIFITIFCSNIIQIIPLTLISTIIFNSAFFLFIDFSQVILWYQYFKKDFTMFLITFLLALYFPLADSLLISAILSLLLILKRNSKPVWFFQKFQFDIEDKSPQKLKYNPKQYYVNFYSKNTFTHYDNNDENIFSSISLQDQIQRKQSDIVLQKNDKNREIPQEFIEQIKENLIKSQINLKKGKKKKMVQDINVMDLCLCHSIFCVQKCHIYVILLTGCLNYMNCNKLKEQCEYLSKLTQPQEEDIKAKVEEEIVYVKLEQGLSIKGIIYDCHHLQSIDITALQTLKAILKVMHSHHIIVKFSNLNPNLLDSFRNYSILDTQSNDSAKNTLSNIYHLFNQIHFYSIKSQQQHIQIVNKQ